MRASGKQIWICLAFLFGAPILCLAEEGGGAKITPTEAELSFLDRLMFYESRGRLTAKNPASSALGPFQFIESTFLDIVRRRLPDVASGKTEAEILALRTNFEVSRTAALIYTRENAAALAARGKEATAANLRLAFFAGVAAALRVIEAKPEEAVSGLFSPAAVAANPFLRSLTAAGLLARAKREAEGLGEAAITEAKPEDVAAVAAQEEAKSAKPPTGASSQPQAPKIAVQCNIKLPSCKRWLALAEKRVNIASSRRVLSARK